MTFIHLKTKPHTLLYNEAPRRHLVSFALHISIVLEWGLDSLHIKKITDTYGTLGV